MMKSKVDEFYWEGITLFNAEEFYECHESLEKIWLSCKGPDRLFYQGLIQLAGGFHHVQKGRMDPARKALIRAIAKLEAYPDQHREITLAALLKEARKWVEWLEEGLGSASTKLEYPKIRKSIS